ncbi:hypothetical protein CMI37_07815 [Candidatus Pacearchaeota archaeon]|nr:hypothetical protein [Candidatus Pacearchaeota archaeon]|tara:strand:- start:11826 stop:12404 length:579 start_codon:yes stop_codon:yes gene_type:complete
MRNVEGYVFIVDYGNIFPMFGRRNREVPILEENRKFDNFEFNDLAAYSSVFEVREGADDYFGGMNGQKIRRINLAQINMKIAESHGEAIEELANETDLITIMINDESKVIERALLGPIVKGKPNFGVLPGAFLRDTNYRTFRRTSKLWKGLPSPFKRAEYLGREVNRQAQCGAMIAKLKLKRLEEIAVNLSV